MFIDGKLVATGAVHVELIGRDGWTSTFKLIPGDDPLLELLKTCDEIVRHHLGDKLAGYRIEVDVKEEEWRRATNLNVRVVQQGLKRAVAAMSFNYWHRDQDRIDLVRRRLAKRLKAFAERIAPRLRTPEQIAASRARAEAKIARQPARLAAAGAEAEAAFDELESAVKKPD